jgi:hypothetical protein
MKNKEQTKGPLLSIHFLKFDGDGYILLIKIVNFNRDMNDTVLKMLQI